MAAYWGQRHREVSRPAEAAPPSVVIPERGRLPVCGQGKRRCKDPGRAGLRTGRSQGGTRDLERVVGSQPSGEPALGGAGSVSFLPISETDEVTGIVNP